MRMNSQSAFTLLEVLIATAILATLSVLASRSLSQALTSKVKIQEQIDDVSQMRDALRLISRDINLAFHYRDLEKELEELIKKKSTGTGTPAGQNPQIAGEPAQQPPPPTTAQQQQTPREVERVDPETHFIGTAEAMSFVTMNNARMVQNSRQADFMEVGYFVRDCKTAAGKSSRCLWRRTAQSVDSDVSTGGVEVALLENISEFSLQYIGKGKQDWVKEWRSTQAGDAATKGNYPAAVEITLGVQIDEPKRKKKYKLQIVASIHHPNNKEQ